MHDRHRVLGRIRSGTGLLADVEDLVNAAVIRDDVPVRALYPDAAELATMKLRRTPKVTTGVRIIDIEGFDLTPCGGTHCTRTGQIGSVSIAGTEGYKGKVRVSFDAAGRALRDARTKKAVLGAMAAELTCGPLDVPAALHKVQGGGSRTKLDAMSSARGELVELLAERIAPRCIRSLRAGRRGSSCSEPKDDLAMLRTLAGRLAVTRPDVVAFCASPDRSTAGDFSSSSSSAARVRPSSTAGAWLKAGRAQAHGGRGGGRPERAEGRLPRSVDLRALAGASQ